MSKPRKLTPKQCAEVLRNWNTTAEFLKEASVEHVRQLLNHELKHRHRKYIAQRLFVRASRLRTKESLAAFLAEHWPDQR